MAAAPYLERLDKHCGEPEKPRPASISGDAPGRRPGGASVPTRLEIERAKVARCGGLAVRGSCDCGEWQKILRCGREWCPTCGQAGSERHLQRYGRWLGRVQTLESAGYWVITWPPAMREALKTRAGRDWAKKAVVTVFKAAGYDVGCGRWHFVGDRHPDVWHPHLNVLVAGGFVPRPQLARLKAALRAALGLPAWASIHYSYRNTPAKLCHVARYITKPHWGPGGLAWEPEVAIDMHGWHNDFWWGKWTGREPAWPIEGGGPTGALISLSEGRCPACGVRILWGHGVHSVLNAPDWQVVAPGYFFRERG